MGYGSKGSKPLIQIDNKEVKGRISKLSDNVNREVVGRRNRKPMITIIDDDGRTDVLAKWEPILQTKSFKMDIAVITGWVGNADYMTWGDLERLKSQYNVDLVNHTHTHEYLGNLTEQGVRDQLQNSTEILKSRGHTHDVLVYPYGSQSDLVRKVVREYCRTGIYTMGGVSTPPLETFKLLREPLIPSTGAMGTVESYTSFIDQAIANNGWIIFMTHSQYEGFDATKIQAVIDYANTNGVEWVHAYEGLDRIGNIVDIGDYPARTQDAEYTVMDADGKWHSKSNSIDYKYLSTGDFAKPITDYAEKKTYMELVLSSGAASFPEGKSGILETFRGGSDDFSYQIYRIYDSNNIYKRTWNDTTVSWNSFQRVDGNRLREHFTSSISGTVPAGGFLTTSITHVGLTNDDNIIGSPRAGIETDLLYNVYISTTDQCRVRIYNPTATDVATNRTWKFDVIKPM
jgi:peptidoglycan/xylan/chitin deacetylase (PgdA/CDA1 family)